MNSSISTPRSIARVFTATVVSAAVSALCLLIPTVQANADTPAPTLQSNITVVQSYVVEALSPHHRIIAVPDGACGWD